MYDLRLLHKLCDSVAGESDPKKVTALCRVLRLLIAENNAETALRLKLVQNKLERIANRIPHASSEPIARKL